MKVVLIVDEVLSDFSRLKLLWPLDSLSFAAGAKAMPYDYLVLYFLNCYIKRKSNLNRLFIFSITIGIK